MRHMDKEFSTLKKILIFKNDRVGDLFHGLNAIEKIFYNNPGHEFHIYLSSYNDKFSFLFSNVPHKIFITKYNLSFIDKINIVVNLITYNYSKIFILTPKNFLFYLPVFFKNYYYAICVNESWKFRPSNFLRSFLFKSAVNDRIKKKPGESISILLSYLCSNDNFPFTKKEDKLINLSPPNGIGNLANPISSYIHVHFKKLFFYKHGWTIYNFSNFINVLSSNNFNVSITSDLGDTDANLILKKNIPTYSENSKDVFALNKIIYFDNIKGADLFALIKSASCTVSPHGTMTVMASYLDVPVVDIFEPSIDLISFREYKPINKSYKFLIIRKFSTEICIKIVNFLKSNLA